MKRSSLLPCVFLVVCFFVAPLTTVRAAIIVSGDVSPSESCAWNSSTVAYVGKTSDGTLTVDADSTLQSDDVFLGYCTGVTGIMTIDGGYSTWDIIGDLHVGGYYGYGTLDITNGAAVSSLNGFIGYESGSAGTVTISGAESQWTNNSYIWVGQYGSGMLNIIGGGTVRNHSTLIGQYTGSMGTVTIDGNGSTWTTTDVKVGCSGSGTLNVTGGGTITCSSTVDNYIAYNTGSTGNVTVEGTGSTWNSIAELYVGYSGSGTLHIADHGIVKNTDGYIGYCSESTSTVTVDGFGSTWTNRDDLYVGYDGNGTLDITAGGSVSSTSSFIGYNAGSTGQVTVAGTDSLWTSSDDLNIGRKGSGTLNITSGGVVVSGTGIVGYKDTGEVNIDGTNSSWTCNDNLTINPKGTLSITNGGLVAVSGATVVNSNSSSTGLISFGDGGGTLSAKTLQMVLPSQLVGTGTVNTQGITSVDVDLVFDATNGSSCTFVLDSQSGQNITVNLDMSNPNPGDLSLGYQGQSSLMVRDGITVYSQSGSLGANSGSTCSTSVIGTGSMWDNSGELDIGGSGVGTLTILNGGTILNSSVRVHSKSSVLVEGAGSTWTNSGSLRLYGDEYPDGGKLTISSGGTVSNTDSYIGYDSDISWFVTTFGLTGVDSAIISLASTDGIPRTGQVTVTGNGSTWINNGNLYLGYDNYIGGDRSATDIADYGRGVLTIVGGGEVSAQSVHINGENWGFSGPTSLLTIDVGSNSILEIDNGNGTLNNSGTVRILAGAGVAPGGMFTPISSGVWSDGTYQSLGGTLDTTAHHFTVSDVVGGTAGTAITLDLADKQRALIVDNASGWRMGASFLALTNSSTLSFTGTTNTGGTLGGLLAAGDAVLSGWELMVDGAYTTDDPVYLSFDVGHAQLLDELQVWMFDGDQWTEFDAIDLTYDRTYASWTAMDMGIYAVTGKLVLDGDSNRDGSTNGTDLNAVLSNYNASGNAIWAMGDFNGDGSVNGSDLNTVLSNYNQSLPASTAAVPEPAGMFLLAVMAMAGLVCLRRAKRR